MNVEARPTGERFAGVEVPDYEQILNCMRCGMCLPHCPTYSIARIERSSPRGRVALIRAVADGRLDLSDGFAGEVYYCLDCRACETACPAGVRVGSLIEAARSQVEERAHRGFWERLVRRYVFGYLFNYTPRLERVALPLRLYQKTGLRRVVQESGGLNMLPPVLRFMEAILPDKLEKPLIRQIPEEIPAEGKEHARVGFFLGCMMSILFSRASRATIRLLAGSGCRVITPKEQRCCGAPLASEGYKQNVADLARFNITLFEHYDLDYVVTDCAACGCVLKEYAELLEDDPEFAERARTFSTKVRDISEFLAHWPYYREPKRKSYSIRRFRSQKSDVNENGEKDIRIAYDQPCHLQHGQGISKEPQDLLRQIPGVDYVDLPESDWCCGGAGLYNITHHAASMQILERKMRHIENISPDVLVTGNPGCLLQLSYGVKKCGLSVCVCHPSELLSAAQDY